MAGNREEVEIRKFLNIDAWLMANTIIPIEYSELKYRIRREREEEKKEETEEGESHD